LPAGVARWDGQAVIGNPQRVRSKGRPQTKRLRAASEGKSSGKTTLKRGRDANGGCAPSAKAAKK